MYERFTDRARKVMQLANQEAQRFNHEYIGTEHVLLGLILEGSGVAANVLKNLNIELLRVRREVEKIIQAGADVAICSKLPQTPRTKMCIEFAMQEAKEFEHNYVGTEHLLLGLLGVKEGVACEVLTILGVKLEDVREEVVNLLGGGVHEGSKTPFLDISTRDLIVLAQNAVLPEPIGRESDVTALQTILARREKNQPILIGTPHAVRSVIYGLAKRLAAQSKQETRLLAFHPAVLRMGCDAKQYRSRLQSLMQEARHMGSVLLHHDEPSLVWKNSFMWFPPATAVKPGAVTSIRLSHIASTTPQEFARLQRKYGPPPERFAVLPIAPFSVEESNVWLNEYKPLLESFHQVTVSDTVVREAVASASKWTKTPLPDSALELLDHALAAHRLTPPKPPFNVAAMRSEMDSINRQKEQAVMEQDFDLAAALRDRADSIKRKLSRMESEWLAALRENHPVTVETVRKMVGTTESESDGPSVVIGN